MIYYYILDKVFLTRMNFEDNCGFINNNIEREEVENIYGPKPAFNLLVINLTVGKDSRINSTELSNDALSTTIISISKSCKY